MDLEDAAGDGSTLAKSYDPGAVSRIAFLFQSLAILILLAHVSTIARAVAVASIVGLFALILIWWKRTEKRHLLIHLMKLELMAALVFLL
jgi:hypothetical protein